MFFCYNSNMNKFRSYTENEEDKKLYDTNNYMNLFMLHSFGHCYNACLPYFSPKIIPYYENMLSIIHRFIETGEIEYMYYLEKTYKNNKNEFYLYKFEFISADDCNIESKYKNWYNGDYINISSKPVIDKNTMKTVYEYYYPNNTEKVNMLLDTWENKELPYSKWVLENRENSYKYGALLLN